ncbi:MAG: carboxymuconolactone decarboxylase family protein [Myxococcaceae bacterium]|nr:carboxymuconolactone decarboxylase family protein [Myxococcaceae bacterium]
MTFQRLVEPPARAPLLLRPLLWLARRITGKDPLPGRLLAWFPRGAVGVGIFEATAAGAPGDLDGRSLAAARIVASAVAGCPFCLDMNAATWRRAGLTANELEALVNARMEALTAMGPRVEAAARYADALSRTPVVVPAEVAEQLRRHFSPREIVVLASTIAQVNFWSRFNQGLGVPSAGFFDESVCRLPASA